MVAVPVKRMSTQGIGSTSKQPGHAAIRSLRHVRHFAASRRTHARTGEGAGSIRERVRRVGFNPSADLAVCPGLVLGLGRAQLDVHGA
jgi:hypothetical protein